MGIFAPKVKPNCALCRWREEDKNHYYGTGFLCAAVAGMNAYKVFGTRRCREIYEPKGGSRKAGG